MYMFLRYNIACPLYFLLYLFCFINWTRYSKEVLAFRGYTHIAIGLAAGWPVRHILGPWGFIMLGLGSLLPDLDHPYSMLGKRLPGIAVFGLGHRGWMHSLIGLAFFALITAIIRIEFTPSIALGYVLHLLADSLNPSGIAWFYPWAKKRRYFIGIPTGGIMECIFILAIFYYLWNYFKF